MENNLDQSGDIAPINNKAGVETPLEISPDWVKKFDEKFGELYEQDYEDIYKRTEEVKSFIAEVEKLAEERGRKDARSVRGYQMGHEHGRNELKAELIEAGEKLFKLNLSSNDFAAMQYGGIYNKAIEDYMVIIKSA